MNESGTFTDQTKLIGLDLQDKFVTRGVAKADIDNDGDIDLIISNNNDEATHAWAELYFKNVGWIAFDPTHNCCTNEKYVRICSGFDSLSAAPIRGVAIGSSEEKLNIKVSVDQVLQQ